MRELNFDETDVVSGGVGGQNYIDLNPGSMIIVNGSVSGNFFNNISLGFGSPAGLEGLSASLGNLMASVLQSLIDAGIIPDPNEIVVNGTRPTPIDFGNGRSIAFYPDGINQLFINGEYAGNIRMTDGYVGANSNNTGTIGVPSSIADSAGFEARENYRFTREH